MRIALILYFASLTLALATGCSAISDFGNYVFEDDVGDDETPAPPGRKPTSFVHTAGGGTCTSADYKLTVSVGMPQPMGNASSENYLIRTGPDSINK